MMKYSKYPWYVDQFLASLFDDNNTIEAGIEIYSKDNELLADLHFPGGVVGEALQGSIPDRSVQEANARLMTHSPELFLKLNEAVHIIEERGNLSQKERAFLKLAHELLEKIKG